MPGHEFLSPTASASSIIAFSIDNYCREPFNLPLQCLYDAAEIKDGINFYGQCGLRIGLIILKKGGVDVILLVMHARKVDGC